MVLNDSRPDLPAWLDQPALAGLETWVTTMLLVVALLAYFCLVG